ncbi:T9SS type A sorting domain-containing protein [Marine Group I thaumarchaeote]|uniref:T9SS type A sorting domain-containing protein n=1 Tax=Marine Group I thaumarchaeote TaxID=2511932 RepID=A0A7K4MQ26_9ARCH|nr:T9SS type A sorting domain-containing protein [Marine Group I thaumarchaeote]
MKLLHQLIIKFWFILIITFGMGQTLELENNNDGTWNVLYFSPPPPEPLIAGFQFNVDGVTVTSAYGGAAEAAGFTITASPTTVLGFSQTQATIPPAIGGILVVLELSGEPTGLSNMVFSDLNGESMDFTFIWEGCPEDLACNYNENTNTNDGTCMYPCSNAGGCLTTDFNFDPDLDKFDCSGNCIVGLDCVGECGGDSTNVETCTGCMDDGYQQWSPNPGSPACNYAQFAIIEGECFYNDCLGECGGTADEDCSGTCLDLNDENWDFSCLDCNDVPNGDAYIDACSQCIGGDTNSPDCLNIDLSFGGYMESNSMDTIRVFLTNLDTLRSLDIEFQYDSSILNITEFSLYGTALNPIGSDNYEYEMAYDTFVEIGISFIKVKFTMYFEPHPDTNLEPFSPEGKENIFNIILETMDIEADRTTQIIINEFSVNEILMDDTNWIGGEILVVVPTGCTDESACNYDPNAREDDGSCAYELDCNGACGGPLLNTCIGGDGDDQFTCETAGGYWSVSGYDICEVCAGSDTDSDNCTCTEELIIYDCNGDCPPIEGCPDEFSFIEGCAQIDECNVCVGGATERYPCEQDCTGEWGGIAYEDNCNQCIADINDIDCFNSSFSIFNSNGIEEDDFIIKELDTIYVALYMQNLPDSLEGIIIDLNYDQSNLSFIYSKLNPSEFDTTLTIPNLLDSSYVLYFDEDSNNGTFLAAIVLTTNVTYQGNDGNILFLQFSNLGNSGDSTVISYNRVQVNEHVMKEQNYTSQVIYFGDCNAVFEGDAYIDECGECVGGNTGIVECDLSNNEYQLIPQSYHLSQNYPNPFNPITYIQYSVPQFDFVTIEIININGQKIKTIVQGSHQPGNYEIMWDGTNHYGISVPSGIYFYKMDVVEFVSVRKLVLLK